MKALHTDKAPAAIGPYSQAIMTNDFVFVSGQLGIWPQTGELGVGIEEQSEQAIKNIEEILKAAGLGLRNVVKVTCYLKHIGDFAAFNAIYEKHFTGKPARSLIQASLPKDAMVEIEVVAER